MKASESAPMCRSPGGLASIRVPTLVVGGVHDTIFSPDVLRGVQASIPGARLALVDSNHEIPIEAPRELAGLVSAFVAGLGPRAHDGG